MNEMDIIYGNFWDEFDFDYGFFVFNEREVSYVRRPLMDHSR
jgi:hypothetical protein